MYRTIYGAQSSDMVDPLMARGNATGAWDTKERPGITTRRSRSHGARPSQRAADRPSESGSRHPSDARRQCRSSKRIPKRRTTQYRKLVERERHAAGDCCVLARQILAGSRKAPRRGAAVQQVLAAIEATNAHAIHSNRVPRAARDRVPAARRTRQGHAALHRVRATRAVDGVAEPTPLFRRLRNTLTPRRVWKAMH